MSNNRSMKEEYLSLMKEYRAVVERLREVGASQEERDLVADDYDKTFTLIRDSLKVSDSEAASGVTTKWSSETK